MALLIAVASFIVAAILANEVKIAAQWDASSCRSLASSAVSKEPARH
jgi:hypothetical protein